MKQITLSLIFAAMLPLTAHAGELKISETDTAIVVEYVGEPDGSQPNPDSAVEVRQAAKPSPPAAMPKPSSATAKTNKSKPATEDEGAESMTPREIERSEALAAKAKVRASLQAAQAEREARFYKPPSSSDPYFPPNFEEN